jgi:multidrug efflux pump subunit AcrB
VALLKERLGLVKGVNDIQDLLQTKIVTPNGQRIPLTTAAEVLYDYQPAAVYRKNRLKTI